MQSHQLDGEYRKMEVKQSPDEFSSIAELYRVIETVESGLVTGNQETLDQADGQLESVAKAIDHLNDETGFERVRLQVALATIRGHLARSRFVGRDADRAYEMALDLIEHAGFDPMVQTRRSASLWTYRGLTSLQGNTTQNWIAAVDQFDRAIELRTRHGQEDRSTRWGLAAAWMNRGDAFGRLGGLENLDEKKRSNEIAEDLLRDFPIDENPAYRIRLALTLMNRGDTILEEVTRYGCTQTADLVQCYDRAIGILRDGVARGEEESRRVLAVALTNLARGRMLVDEKGSTAGEREAREALQILREEADRFFEMDSVRLDLTARVTLCRTLENSGSVPAFGEITDLAEDGLELFKKLVGGGESVPTDVEVLVAELFHCGAEAYLREQPQFLSEYLLDSLDPERDPAVLASSVQCHEIAVQVLWKAVSETQSEGFLDLGSEEYEKKQELLAGWFQCRERLASVRDTRFTFAPLEGGRRPVLD